AIKMNEDDTTSSSRIFVKIMMQEVTGKHGLPTLKERFADQEIRHFAINYFTSVGLGALTEEMRETSQTTPCNVGGRIILFRQFL
ncbi:hypothetical protein EDB86DRAFT_2937043, partial [Lactarius hatsudake]